MLRRLAAEMTRCGDLEQTLSTDPRIDVLLDWVVGERAWHRHVGGTQPNRQESYRAQISLVAEAYVAWLDRLGLTLLEAEEAVMAEFESDFGPGGYAPAPYPVDLELALEFSSSVVGPSAEDLEESGVDAGYFIVREDLLVAIAELRPKIFG